MRSLGRNWPPLLAPLLAGLLAAGFLVYDHGQPVPVPARENLYKGVEYARNMQWSPRPMIVHVITIDMRTAEKELAE
jgi:hypothetical protein